MTLATFTYFTSEEMKSICEPGVRSLCLIASYDHGPDVASPNLVQMLYSLSRHFDRLLLLTNIRTIDDAIKLPGNCRVKMVPNQAHDFGMWARFCHSYDGCGGILTKLALVNDSCIIVKDLGPCFRHAKGLGAEFWGMTLSTEGPTHLQSYFLVADGADCVNWLTEFFRNKDFAEYVGAPKQKIVRELELGISQHMSARYPLIGLYSMKDVKTPMSHANQNPTYLYWDALLTAGFPLLKKARRPYADPAAEAAFIKKHVSLSSSSSVTDAAESGAEVANDVYARSANANRLL